MRGAINTVCLPELAWPEALAACKAAGFSRIELLAVPGWAHVDARTEETKTLKIAACRLGVEYVGVHAGGIDGRSEETLAGSLEYLSRALDFAESLSCSRLVFSGAPWPEELTGSLREEILLRLARGLATLAPRAAARGLRICVENHYRCQVETLEDYQTIFAAVPSAGNLFATVDTGHFTASEVDPAAVVRALGARVGNVHVKDHVGTESVALGRGNTDNAAVVRALKALGYRGDLTVELEVHDRENALQYVRDAYPYITALIGD